MTGAFRWSRYAGIGLLCCLIFHASYTESLQVKLNCPCSITSLNEKNPPAAFWRCHVESQVPLTLWEWIHNMISYEFAQIAWSVEEIKRSTWISAYCGATKDHSQKRNKVKDLQCCPGGDDENQWAPGYFEIYTAALYLQPHGLQGEIQSKWTLEGKAESTQIMILRELT